MESVIGLKESFPEKAIAVTTVGDARKFIVSLLPSLRDLKLRLKEVRIAFSSPCLSSRFHCKYVIRCQRCSHTMEGKTHLSNAGSAGIGEDRCADALEFAGDLVTLDGCSDLLRTWGTKERDL